MPKITSPHDRFFKALLSNQKIAQAFFRAHLPEEILAKIDLEQLQLFRNEYVDEKLKVEAMDILYYSPSVTGEPDYYLYLLIEHQSSPQRLLPLRVLRYQLDTISLHVSQRGYQGPLPIVFPMVFYQGQQGYTPYPYSLNILDLFVDRQLATSTLAQEILLVDLNTLEDQDILKHELASVLELTAKHSRHLPFEEVLKVNQRELLNVCNLEDQNLSHLYLETFISYILAITEGANRQKFIEAWDELPPLKDKAMTTLADVFRQEALEKAKKEVRQESLQEGRDEGRAEGREEGLQEGQEVASQAIARNLRALGIPVAQIAKATQLSPLVIRRLKPGAEPKNAHSLLKVQVRRKGNQSKKNSRGKV